MNYVPSPPPLKTHFGPRSKRARVKSANEQIKQQLKSDFKTIQEQAIKSKKYGVFQTSSTGPK